MLPTYSDFKIQDGVLTRLDYTDVGLSLMQWDVSVCSQNRAH